MLIRARYVSIHLLSQLATRCDTHGLPSCTARRADCFNLLNHIHALGYLAKNTMLAIQEGGVRGADKKLAAVRVGSGIRHREGPRPTVADVKVLVSELITVDGLAASAILVREVASLTHEAWNDTVERAVGVAKAFITSAKRAEIFGRLGNDAAIQPHLDAPGGLATD